MLSFKSLLDPNHKYDVDEGEWVVAMLKSNDPNDANSVSLMLEGLNEEGKYVLIQYSFKAALNSKSQPTITVNQRVVNVNDRESVFTELVQDPKVNRNIWPIFKHDAWLLNGNIVTSDSYKEQGHFENYTSIGFIGGLSENRNPNLDKRIEYFNKRLTQRRYLPFTENVSFTCKYTQNEHVCFSSCSTLDSFTWARHLLYGSYINTLPKTAELIGSQCDEKSYDQLMQFEIAIKTFTENADNQRNKNFYNVKLHLENIMTMLKNEYRNFVSTKFLLNLSTEFTQSLNGIQDENVLLEKTQLFAKHLDEKWNEIKLDVPQNKSLKTAICGLIGAAVGFAIGTVIGAGVTAWSGSFGALPGAILGATKGMTAGFAVGLGTSGIGAFIGSLFGYNGANKKQTAYQERLKELNLITKVKQEVLAMTNSESLKTNKRVGIVKR